MPAATERAPAKPIPTSLKLPADLKASIDQNALKAGLTPHAFMVKTLGDATDRIRQREGFQQDSLDAL